MVIQQKYDYAGEVVTIAKVVDATSAEAAKHRAKDNLDDILESLTGKKKITTMGKSKLDWDRFKDKAGITEELEQAAKSKDGYLAKQQFLEEANYKQFERERDERLKRIMSRPSTGGGPL